MENDFQNRLKTVLSDPDALSKIAEIAQNINGNQPQKDRAGEDSYKFPPRENFRSGSENTERRAEKPPVSYGKSAYLAAFLKSLKPLLREEKREKVDTLIKVVSAASLIGPIKGGK